MRSKRRSQKVRAGKAHIAGTSGANPALHGTGQALILEHCGRVVCRVKVMHDTVWPRQSKCMIQYGPEHYSIWVVLYGPGTVNV